ncbi:MAG: hypothetical protein M3R00_06800, partial [Pseudomonadota bacterium]|nr:hypothetical protein [Pseudomonadota bacterium]
SMLDLDGGLKCDIDLLLHNSLLQDFYLHDDFVNAIIRCQGRGSLPMLVAVRLLRFLSRQNDDVSSIAAALMLNEKYNITNDSEHCYSLLMGLHNKFGHINFRKFIVEYPDQHCNAMLRVCHQFDYYLEDVPLPNAFLLKLLAQCARTIIKNRPLAPADRKEILQIISRLSADQYHMLLQKLGSDMIAPLQPMFVSALGMGIRSSAPAESIIAPTDIIESAPSKADASRVLFSIATIDSCTDDDFREVLAAGADPLFEEENTCALIKSIMDPSSRLVDFLCVEAIAGRFTFDFKRLNALCPDAVQLADELNGSRERIALMIDAGFKDHITAWSKFQ